MNSRDDPRDLSQYSAWRETVEPEVEKSFTFYGTYLSGQCSGMSEALDLSAVKAALEIEDVAKEEWPDEAQRCLLIHSELMPILRREAKRA